jgi:hypothetical protein
MVGHWFLMNLVGYRMFRHTLNHVKATVMYGFVLQVLPKW